MNRIPPDAFAFYYSLGPQRSYEAVAQEYGVTRQAVAKLAAKENWKKRVGEIDQEARAHVDQKIVETVEGMHVRHLKMLKVVQSKALSALRESQIQTAMDAVRALDISIKQERLIRGEPTEREEIGVAQVVEKESRRWLTVLTDGDEESAEGDASGESDGQRAPDPGNEPQEN